MNTRDKSSETSIQRLLSIMERLRDEDEGCEWDKEQDFNSLTPFIIEEAYEVVDAISRNDKIELKFELGDLLLQIIFLSQIAKENNFFEFTDVVDSLCQKLIDRHPYVFGDPKKHTSKAQTKNWEILKKKERKQKGFKSILDNIPKALPALIRSQKIQKRASSVGFDWSDNKDYFRKIEEELNELKNAISLKDQLSIKEELGDLFMIIANLSAKLGVDAEGAMDAGNKKFERRFRFIESELEKRNKSIYDSTIEEMDSLWNKSKEKN
ncbi:MAG: nucleoside triphosphate pyrophosphohydrolase [SAR86 cluster bacterium]|nr:nucleoside triphosphate pyrophosphohydrolase [SAR86 cluster bacterium]